MRLLYITGEMPYGRGESFVYPEVREILRRGHELLIVPRSASAPVVNHAAEDLRQLSLAAPVFSMKILTATATETTRHPLRTAKAVVAALWSSNPDAVCRNLVVLPKALWLAQVARQWRADHIHAHWASTMSTMAMVVGELTGIPWSFTAHRGDIISNNLLARKVKKASFVRLISQSGLNLAQRYGARQDGDKLCIIHMGAVLPSATVRRVSPEHSRSILCAANLIPVKGIQHLLDAVHRLEKRGIACRLTIAGTGPLRDELQNAAQALRIDDRVSFVGHIPQDELLALYADGKVAAVVLPSVDLGGGVHEGIPVTLMEAMAHGIPVVATRTGGIPELLGDGAGIMVPGGDAAALADAIETLFVDADLREQIAERGKAKVEREFAITAVVGQLLERIEATLPGPNSIACHATATVSSCR